MILATSETARTVHHWLDVPWHLESLWDSTALQTSLSILWAVIGLSGMVAGVRMARRAVWVAGASWMAVVVAKLFVVDLRNLTAAGRVVSFIVVGVLLLIVGYLAPVPPAGSEESEEPSEDPAPDESEEPSEDPAPDESEEPSEDPAPDESEEPSEDPAPDEPATPEQTAPSGER